MPTYQQWQIWDVKFPYQENDGRWKRRPALLVTTKAEFDQTGILRFAYVTSIDHPKIDYRIELFPSHPDIVYEPFKRLRHCWVHCAQWVDLPPADVIEYRGILIGDLKQQAMEIHGLA